MSVVKYSFNSRVRFSEVDENGVLTLTSLINYFQDSTFFFSEERGIGVDYMNRIRRAWFLGSWQIVIRRMPCFGQEIVVRTWACGFRHFTGFRNFTLETPEGELLAAAYTIWAYLDLEKGIPVKPTEEEAAMYLSEEPLNLDFGPRKTRLPREGVSKDPLQVQRYQLDTNHHMNNAQYIAVAEEFLPEQAVLTGVRAEYKTAAVLGDRMIPVVYQTETGCAVSLNQENGKAYAIIEFIYEKDGISC